VTVAFSALTVLLHLLQNKTAGLYITGFDYSLKRDILTSFFLKSVNSLLLALALNI